MFPQLKADIAAAGEHVGAELGSELQSVTLAFNDECSTLLDLRTRYESSILLWEKFTSLSQDTRHWLDSALDKTTGISSSLEPPAALLSQLESLDAEARGQQHVVEELRHLTTDICIQTGMDEAGRSHFAVEVEELDHRISTLRDSITSLHQTFNTRKTD